MNSISGEAALKTSGMRKMLLNLSAGLIVLAFTALLLAAAELTARLAINNTGTAHKVFPEFSRAIYKTTEFDCVANVNRFGFRGVESRLLPGQVVIIGDSYVFGWGVSDEETWPKKLQDDFSRTGVPLKVYNLGRPGADPDDYLDIARAYVPVLKPKVLLVSLLQADDLVQLLQKRSRKTESHEDASTTQFISRTVEKNFPGLISAARSFQHPIVMATATWEADVRFRMQNSTLFKSFDDRMAILPPDIRSATETGNFNPAMISTVSEFPRALLGPYEDPEATWLEERIVKVVEQLKSLVEMNGGALVLLSMPQGAYFPTETRKNWGRMGFELPSLEFDKPDDFAERIAARSHVQSILLTRKLRPRGDLGKMWYGLDGHPTKYGNEVLEKYISEALLSVVAEGHGP